MTTFSLSIYALDREIFWGEAEALTLPTQDGEIQILADHTPLVALLKEGDMKIEGENNFHQTLPIAGGVVEVTPQEVVVLVNF
ncbi:MAG: F-type H+-transporting ATPase subunit epsilon [Parcubacteria group bacterium Greene0714_21]|nr:MAG: F-type H+-transporting ATPase subunit epsilon [Parcubacteria group bacterium Greene0416_39]TSC97526.1 MAG: F-type H+-transporting ATPase subunit epsilon [Parcubacteria group bacterium Greene1014_47]TSD04402.1 MAG: F-type H+-transporting ATPase subunit epsilon [Parcubacteria group bacterium Greene0714_21]